MDRRTSSNEPSEAQRATMKEAECTWDAARRPQGITVIEWPLLNGQGQCKHTTFKAIQILIIPFVAVHSMEAPYLHRTQLKSAEKCGQRQFSLPRKPTLWIVIPLPVSATTFPTKLLLLLRKLMFVQRLRRLERVCVQCISQGRTFWSKRRHGGKESIRLASGLVGQLNSH